MKLETNKINSEIIENPLEHEKSQNSPLVTVNILSFNRKDELRNTLTKVYEQDYKNIEVIVVDNASLDGSPEMVEQDFPDVILIRMCKNIGIAGWNEGFKIAKGEYVLVLDDDSYPIDRTLKNGIAKIMESEMLGAVAFNVYNSMYERSETCDFLENPCFFNGCGALIRKSIFKEIGYYSNLIFLYYNELEFCSRIYDKDFKIVYLENAYCIHQQSNRSRGNMTSKENPFKSEYRFYYFFVSYSIFILLRMNFIPGFLFLIKWHLNRLIIALRMNYWESLFKGLIHLILLLPKILKEREVLKVEVQRFYRYGNEVLVDRTYFPNFKKPKFLLF